MSVSNPTVLNYNLEEVAKVIDPQAFDPCSGEPYLPGKGTKTWSQRSERIPNPHYVASVVERLEMPRRRTIARNKAAQIVI